MGSRIYKSNIKIKIKNNIKIKPNINIKPKGGGQGVRPTQQVFIFFGGATRKMRRE